MSRRNDAPFDGIALAVFDTGNPYRTGIRWVNEAQGRCSVDFANRNDAWAFRRDATGDILTEPLTEHGRWVWLSSGQAFRETETDWLCYDIKRMTSLVTAYSKAASAFGQRGSVHAMARMRPDVVPVDPEIILATGERVRRAMSTLNRAASSERMIHVGGRAWYSGPYTGGPKITSVPELAALLRRLNHDVDVFPHSELLMMHAGEGA